jgi:MFS family permease
MRKSCFSFSDDGVDNSITLKVLEDGGFTKKEPEWTPGKNVYTVMRPVMVVSLLVTLDAMVLVPVVSVRPLLSPCPPAPCQYLAFVVISAKHQQQMISEFGGSSIGSFWFGAVYLLTCAIFQPFIASTSEIFGRREAVTFSIWLFLLGTYICAPLAGNLILVIVGRAIQGIGAAGIIAMNQVIFSGTVTLRCRPVLFYISIGMWALGSILGPLTAGVFVEKLSWKYCFYINVRSTICTRSETRGGVWVNTDTVYALRSRLFRSSRPC